MRLALVDLFVRCIVDGFEVVVVEVGWRGLFPTPGMFLLSMFMYAALMSSLLLSWNAIVSAFVVSDWDVCWKRVRK